MRLLCRAGRLDVRMAKAYELVWETVEASAGVAVMQLVQQDLRCMESWRHAYAEKRETCREGGGDIYMLCVRIWLAECTKGFALGGKE